MLKMEILKMFLVSEGYQGMQTFKSANTVGDKTETVFYACGVTVKYAPGYGYLEIFGLTDTEYQSLNTILDIWNL